MEKTEIKQWNAVQSKSTDNVINPMLYFVPSPKDIIFIENNNNHVMVHIKDSEMCDGFHWGTVGISSKIPNCRPTFFDVTNYYVITLDNVFFNRFPDPEKLGHFTFVDKSYYDDSKNVGENKNPEKEKEQEKNDNVDKSHRHDNRSNQVFGNNFWIFLIVILLLFFLVIFLVSYKK